MTTRRRWTQDSIRHEIAPIVAELGRMPTRRQLSDRGLAAAWSAMQRHGGLAAWRHVLTAPATAPSPAAPDASAAAEPAAPAPARPRVVAIAPSVPSRHDIAQRAYFIAQQRGGDPVANWLAAERELLAA
jgi:hypothetical protein